MTLPVQRSWWKEPMVWLVAGLPVLAVIASFATYFIAANNTDTLVNAGYMKEGLAPIKDTAKEARAESLAIEANLELASGQARINLTGRFENLPDSLVLLLIHPTDDGQDTRIVLTSAAPGQYVAPMLVEGHAGKRQWIIEPVNQDWRMTGELSLPLNGTLKLGKDSLLNPP